MLKKVTILLFVNFLLFFSTSFSINYENNFYKLNLNSIKKNILFPPIDEFKNRITKKTFGIFITPKNSPIKPEKFTGYHAGVDVEYDDIKKDVPVYAISDGVVVVSKIASGYGGVFIIKVDINGFSHSVLYGHIRPSSLPKIGKKISKGQKIALLGTGYSRETDGERRHLHFAILSNNRIDLKGYVQSKVELSGWMDPLIFF